MLGLAVLGLAGYALWRLIQAVGNPEGEGAVKRMGHWVAGLIYVGLAFAAGRLEFAPGSRGGSPKGWTALVLSVPLGWVVVSGVGVFVALSGLDQLYEAYEAEFREYLNLDEPQSGEVVDNARGAIWGCRPGSGVWDRGSLTPTGRATV
jgi:hypothetical protein